MPPPGAGNARVSALKARCKVGIGLRHSRPASRHLNRRAQGLSFFMPGSSVAFASPPIYPGYAASRSSFTIGSGWTTPPHFGNAKRAQVTIRQVTCHGGIRSLGTSVSGSMCVHMDPFEHPGSACVEKAIDTRAAALETGSSPLSAPDGSVVTVGSLQTSHALTSAVPYQLSKCVKCGSTLLPLLGSKAGKLCTRYRARELSGYPPRWVGDKQKSAWLSVSVYHIRCTKFTPFPGSWQVFKREGVPL